jgi:hypothetical protein
MKTQNNPITESTAVNSNSEVKKNGMSPIWQSVLVGGVPGILIGAAGTIGVEAIADPKQTEETEEVMQPEEVEVETTTEILEAHSVTDEMSFSEAFAAARNEVGPGGAFVWHGQVYGTYRGDDPEWQEMSAEDRTAHSQAIISQVHPAPYIPTQNEPLIEVVEEDNSPAATPASSEDSHDDEVDIHIVGVEQGQTEDGTLVTVGYGAVDGQYAEFVDSDGDGEVDTVLIDHNNNQELDEGEVHGVAGSGLTIDDMVAQAQANTAAAVDDALYGEMPDYTNDADTSSYV